MYDNLNSNLDNNIAGYSINSSGGGEPAICFGLFYNGTNWKLSGIQHWKYDQLGTKTWYDVQIKFNSAITNFDITALEDCYYSYNVDMSNKQKFTKGETISIYHRDVFTIYYQSI